MSGSNAGNEAVIGAPIQEGEDTTAARAQSADERKARIRQALLTAPILPTLLKLGWPTIVVLVVQTMVGVAETYYVSYLGTAALAGVTLVFPILMLMAMMSNGGIGGGVASAVARAIGSGRKHDADALVTHSVVLAIIFGLVFTTGVIGLGPKLYSALGGSDAALDAALRYSFYAFIGAVPAWIMNLLASAMRGSGNVRVPAILSFVGALIMIPLSPAFIFGFGPIPRFGIAGAGIAVTLYYILATIALIYYLASGRSNLVLRWVPLEMRLFRDILRVGLISAVSTIQPNLTVVVVTGVVGLFGADALAGYGIASRLDYVLIPILFGFGTGVVTMVGTNMGAGNLARAKRIAWIGVAVGFAVTEIIGVIVALAPTLWLHLFSREAGVIATGSTYLHTVAPVYGALGITMLLSFAAQGGGRVLWPFLGGTARLVIAAGLGWFAVTHWGFGLAGQFTIIAAGLLASALISAIATLAGAIWRTGVE
ncbi:MAG TPA: MATE family efflux transporter [Magnetospirillaceae bacterium]|jgi:putative MATE family efflux protein